jgi:hypothetical protein
MVKGIEAAVAKLSQRTAADLFRDIEPLDDTSAEEMQRAIQESREDARKLEAIQEPPERL